MTYSNIPNTLAVQVIEQDANVFRIRRAAQTGRTMNIAAVEGLTKVETYNSDQYPQEFHVEQTLLEGVMQKHEQKRLIRLAIRTHLTKELRENDEAPVVEKPVVEKPVVEKPVVEVPAIEKPKGKTKTIGYRKLDTEDAAYVIENQNGSRMTLEGKVANVKKGDTYMMWNTEARAVEEAKKIAYNTKAKFVGLIA